MMPRHTTLLVLLAACGHSPQPRLYALQARPGVVASSLDVVVEVRRPSLAGYLDRREVISQVVANQVELEPRAIWAEPLDGMVGRVLAANLAARLPNSRVYSELSNLSGSPALRAEVAIEQLDRTPDDKVVLRALVALRSVGGQREAPRRIELRAHLSGTSTADLVRAWDELLGRLADELARSIR